MLESHARVAGHSDQMDVIRIHLGGWWQ